jgi:hypothetical protein
MKRSKKLRKKKKQYEAVTRRSIRRRETIAVEQVRGVNLEVPSTAWR